MAVVGSPFTSSGTAQRLPPEKCTGPIVLRCVGSTDTDAILVRIHRDEVVESGKADFILYHKEAIEICGGRVRDASEISVIALSGTPSVYWGRT